MDNYLVLLKEAEEAGGAPQGRREVYESGRERGKAFERKLKRDLAERGLADQVAAVTSTSFDLLAVRCTPEAAKAIASLPEVEGVTIDRDDLRLVR
jgi:hypothetical protein